jgi:DNA topoisomerase-1
LFHEITKPAIIAAVAAPTRINMSEVYAQHARQVLDMIVGFKISPFLWKYIYSNKSNALSAGRCQTPALRLVYENEKERLESSVTKKYKTTAYFTSKSIPFVLDKEFEKETDILSFLEQSRTFEDYRMSIGLPKENKISPPKPFCTSKLLQSASNVLNLSPQQTMMYCQELYQEGHITYMRTDSTKYSKDFITKATSYIEQTWGGKYLGDLDKIVNKDTVNPHEAIRVTHIENNTVHCKEPKMASLYKLIWKNTIQSCMVTSVNKVIDISISAPYNHSYKYVLEMPLFIGWKIVENKTTDGTTTTNLQS